MQLPPKLAVSVVLDFGALSAFERIALEQCARGALFKQVASELQVGPSRLSRLLASATSKLGLGSSTEALRLMGGILGPRVAHLETLTRAEREVFDLIKAGLANQQIATRRGTTERTIANQVGAVLRKTGLSSRRAVIASRV